MLDCFCTGNNSISKWEEGFSCWQTAVGKVCLFWSGLGRKRLWLLQSRCVCACMYVCVCVHVCVCVVRRGELGRWFIESRDRRSSVVDYIVVEWAELSRSFMIVSSVPPSFWSWMDESSSQQTQLSARGLSSGTSSHPEEKNKWNKSKA